MRGRERALGSGPRHQLELALAGNSGLRLFAGQASAYTQRLMRSSSDELAAAIASPCRRTQAVGRLLPAVAAAVEGLPATAAVHDETAQGQALTVGPHAHAPLGASSGSILRSSSRLSYADVQKVQKDEGALVKVRCPKAC